MKPLDLLYAPLSRLYGLGVFVRNLLYDEHVFVSHSVTVPTICVGNLAVGGTGKTPHVEYLLRSLSRDYKMAVLSRGYKRKTRGFLLADAQSTARTIGDEAMQIHTKFPDIPVAVCENRVHGVRQLQKRIEGLQAIILDDAYQHRALRCGFYILLTPYDRLYIDDHLLPWGRLRDMVSQSQRANAVIVTKCPPDLRPIDRRVIVNRLGLSSFQHVYFTQLDYQQPQHTGNPLVVTGIAQTDYMMQYVRSLYPRAELMAFADHHAFSPADIERIAKRAEAFDFVLTTEKDYQRLLLTNLPALLGDHLQVLSIRVAWQENFDAFDAQVRAYLHEALRKNTK